MQPIFGKKKANMSKMKSNSTEKKTTGAGDNGIPRPGATGIIEHVPTASSLDDCKTTACGVDPGPSVQTTTGMNTLIRNMEQIREKKELTAAGGVEAPRPGTEGIVERIPSASSSIDRDSEQVAGQACSAKNTTGAKWARKRPRKTPTMMISENESDSRDSLLLSSDEFEDDENEYFMDSAGAPPPSKRSESLPRDEEKAAVFRDMPCVNLMAIILQCAEIVEKVATSNNFKKIHKRYLRFAAENMRISATELLKRIKNRAAQKREIVLLRARNRELKKKLAELTRENPDLLIAAAIAESWPKEPEEPVENVKLQEERCQTTMAVCDASMPRAWPWTSEIAEMRVACVQARREYMRARRRKIRDAETEEELRAKYRKIATALKRAIKDAKAQ